MNAALVDTSVLIKWFHSTGETEVAPARAVLDAHLDGRVELRVLDLGLYELGNVLGRSLRWPSDRVADQIDDLIAVCGPVVRLDDASWRVAADLAHEHRLTFYDAAWAAAARQLRAPLVTADEQILAAGLAVSAATMAKSLHPEERAEP